MQFKSLRQIFTFLIILGLSLAVIHPAAGSNALSKPVQAEPAALASISGVVTDGGVPGLGLHGYPLYARIRITASGFDQTAFTNPLTGAYSIDLEEGIEYTFTIEAYSPGYQTLVQTLTPTAGTLTLDFTLLVDPVSCTAPGYQQDYDLFFDFESSVHGFTHGGITSFAWGEFTSGPMTGHSGSKGIATNPAGLYSPNENGYMLSPMIDLSGYGVDHAIIQWWDWKYIKDLVIYDSARLDVTRDGGSNWTTVWGPVGNVMDTDYHQQTVVLDPIYNVVDFQFRFFFESDTDKEYPGWYIDDIGILSVPVSKTTIFSNSFDTDNGGFLPGGDNPSWEWGSPTSGPGIANSTPKVWATNLAGNYNDSEKSWMISPIFDLSSYAGQTPIITFYQWNDIEGLSYDWGQVEATKDGGITWEDISGKIGDITSWSPMDLILDSSYAVSDFQFRFYFNSDGSINYAGWYIDDLTLAMSEPVVFSARCIPTPGGVIAGYVTDENTGLPLVGAEVSSSTQTTQSFQWSGDGHHPGLYWFFQATDTDPQIVEVSASKELYSSQIQSLSIAQDAINPQDFTLQAGDLAFEPTSFSVPMTIGDPSKDQNLVLSNSGGKEVLFSLTATDTGYELPLSEMPYTRSTTDDFPYDTTGPFAVRMPVFSSRTVRVDGVSWLSLAPNSGTVPSQGTTEVTLSFDPSTLPQPGDYYAEILVTHDTPYTYPSIPVTLQLAAPADWGTIKGTVQGLEACDINPSPLVGAEVSFWQEDVMVGGMQTTETGYYSYSLPNGTYDIKVTMDGYLEIIHDDILLEAGVSLSEDFILRLLAPCLGVNPTNLSQNLLPGETASQTLILTNTGAAEASFEILEAGGDRDAMILYESFEYEGFLPADWDTFHNGITSQRWTTVNKPAYVFDGHYAAWVLYDDSLSSDEWLLTPVIDATLLTDLNLSFMALSNTNYPGATVKLWVTDENGSPLTIEPEWDLIRDETWPDLDYYPVNKPLTAFNRYGEIRLAWQYVGLNGESFGLDLVQLTGNVDVTWLTREPTSDVIAPDGGSAEISIGFDAAGLEPGDYYANLSVMASPNPLINIPVALHVIEGTGPIVSDIPDQTITLGESFETILLDDYVVDVDHSDEQISWFSSGNSALIVTIDGNRVATISYPPDWTGSETITFTATDPDEQLDFTTAIFTVLPEGSKIFLPLILR